MAATERIIQRFIEEYSLRLAKNTLTCYRIALEQLFSYCEKPYQDITSTDIRDWLLFLNRKGFKSETIRTKLFGIKLFYSYCLEESEVKESPVDNIPFPAKEETLPYYLEMNQLLELRMFVKDKPKEQAIVEVLYATGIRISELAAMEKEDINWSERMIHIPSAKRKQDRVVLFTRLCEERLRTYLQTRVDDLPWVFTNHLGTGKLPIISIQEKLATYGKKLGFFLSAHTMRHTFAAHLAQKGMPLSCIQALLGHTKVSNTQIYTRLYNHARKQMYDEWM